MTKTECFVLIVTFLLFFTLMYIDMSSIQSNDMTLEPLAYDFTLGQENVSLDLTYSSNEDTESRNVTDGSILVGDHIVLRAEFSSSELTQEITQSSLGIEDRVLSNQEKSLVIPEEEYDPFSGILNHSQFSWVTVKGLRMNAMVNITANFTNGDCDFFVFTGEMNPDNYRYSSNIADNDMSTGAKPETESLIWQSMNDTMIVACFDYDLQPGNWTLRVVQTGETLVTAEGSVLNYDTYEFGMNITTSLVLNYTVDDQEVFTFEYSNLTFNNFFTPSISEFNYTQTGSIGRFMWNIHDTNTAELYDSDLFLSGDGGNSFQLIAFNLGETLYQLDTDGFTPRNDYYARVEVTDSSGLTNEAEIGPFSLGTEFLFSFDAQASGPDNVSVRYGETVRISWDITLTGTAPPEVDYFIYLGNLLIKTGTTSGENISVNIPDLAPGNYSVKLCLIDSKTLRDVVFLTVEPRPFWLTLTFQTISLVSAGIMLFFSILIFDHFYKKRKSQQGTID